MTAQPFFNPYKPDTRERHRARKSSKACGCTYLQFLGEFSIFPENDSIFAFLDKNVQKFSRYSFVFRAILPDKLTGKNP